MIWGNRFEGKVIKDSCKLGDSDVARGVLGGGRGVILLAVVDDIGSVTGQDLAKLHVVFRSVRLACQPIN